MKRKIFVLGLTHTGKNSLDAALEKLGYTYKHYPYPDKVLELAKQFDVLSDTPVIPFMEKLDALYPDARFIITVRDMKSWLESCQSHWKRRPKRNLCRCKPQADLWDHAFRPQDLREGLQKASSASYRVFQGSPRQAAGHRLFAAARGTRSSVRS